jgi:pilus assembly protein Flp/PilA
MKDVSNTMPIIDTWNCWVTHLRARLGTDERGASLVEYALLVALIAVICIVAIAFLGQSASTKFSTVGSSIGS